MEEGGTKEFRASSTVRQAGPLAPLPPACYQNCWLNSSHLFFIFITTKVLGLRQCGFVIECNPVSLKEGIIFGLRKCVSLVRNN